MSHRREFEIAFVGLKTGLHEFNYEITDRFFEVYQQQDFQNCQAHVKLTLDKQTGFLLLKFEVGGTLQVTCDRCNNNLPMELWEDFNLIVRLAEDPGMMNNEEEDPDVYYISRGESHIDVADWIYEFINLSLPMQKTCNYEKMDGSYCNPAARDVLKKLTSDDSRKENPIWKGLEKFKGLE